MRKWARPVSRILIFFASEIETKTGRGNRDQNWSRKMRLVWARHSKPCVRNQARSQFPRPVLVSISDAKNSKFMKLASPISAFLEFVWIGNCVNLGAETETKTGRGQLDLRRRATTRPASLIRRRPELCARLWVQLPIQQQFTIAKS